MWPPFCLTTSCKRTLAFVTTFRHKSSESALHNFTIWALSCATFSGPHSEVVLLAFSRLVSKSCDECKGSFARGCEAKRWSHWTCFSLGTIFQPMRINSVPDFKCFYNNKNVLRAQSMVWHFVRHPVYENTKPQCRIMNYFTASIRVWMSAGFNCDRTKWRSLLHAFVAWKAAENLC